jgi:hypothetical protein
MKTATCHPERKHWAKGLCNACWQNARYTKNPVPQRERVRKWAHDHRAQVLERKKAYYLRHFPNAESRATRQSRVHGIILPKVIELPEPPTPREWWKLQERETPRRWILEAA